MQIRQYMDLKVWSKSLEDEKVLESNVGTSLYSGNILNVLENNV